jgi:glutamine synthetase
MKNFISNIEAIQKFLSSDNSGVVRFIFTDAAGNFQSIAVLSSKIQSLNFKNALDLKQILDILRVYGDKNLVLLPDSHTSFTDPCSVQHTHCILCSVVSLDDWNYYDDRSIITQIKDDKKFDVVCGFTLNDSKNIDYAIGIDVFFDLRSEVLLESFKVGVDINSHHVSDNNLCRISFSAANALNLGDSIQKIKMIVRNIGAAYGKSVCFSESEIRIKSDIALTAELQVKAKNLFVNIDDSNNNLTFKLNTIDINPYSLMKALFL